MKPKLSLLSLLLSLSTLTILQVHSEESEEAAPKTEQEVKSEQLAAYYEAMEEQILAHLNSEASFASRFSRVLHPMPKTYYEHQIVSHGADGNISFKIVYIDQLNLKTRNDPTTVATGTYNSKTNGVLLMDDQTGKSVPAAEHQLVKNGKQAKVGKVDPATIQPLKP